MKILCIIQARCGSTRLQNKVLLPLVDKTVLEHVIYRVSLSKNINDIIVATTLNKEDIKIVNLVSSLGYRVFCGSEDDVLDRYFQVAKILKPEHIVRITADCPLIDPKIIDLIIDKHFSEKSDYTSNTLIETYPDGLDVEIFTYNALKEAWLNAKLLSEREHVTPYIRKNEDFKKVNVKNNIDLSKYRLTLDRIEDYKLIKIIFENIYVKKKDFFLEDVIKFLENNPELININKNIKRNEGYEKSLLTDRTLNLEYIKDE